MSFTKHRYVNADELLRTPKGLFYFSIILRQRDGNISSAKGGLNFALALYDYDHDYNDDYDYDYDYDYDFNYDNDFMIMIDYMIMIMIKGKLHVQLKCYGSRLQRE